ncbi:Protein kinase superfamily protein [Hirschfeldia incana]|nr:Protein kinase superfamily protein [Hirschfeldia incana]
MGCIISSRRKKPAPKESPVYRPRFQVPPPTTTVIANDDDDQAHKVSETVCGPKELKREESVLVVNPPRSSELADSGWPPWLIPVAGEALVGWLPRRESHFEKQEQIGRGTFSKVFKAKDLLRNKTVALKRIRFDLNDSESIRCIAREIIILRKLDHPNIIKLEGLMLVEQDSSILYMIFEYMEHDLLGLSSSLGVEFSEPQVKCYMRQLLRGLDHCHTNHVLHRDIKSSNLLINQHGVLKIADFGLSTFFDPQNSVPLTTNVVTLWYRPPELLLGASHYSVGIDMWSTGCVIGEIYAGKPILPGKNEREQLQKIFELCGSPSEVYWRKLKLSSPLRPMFSYGSNIADTFKEFPVPVISLLETLLSIDPDSRGTAATALNSEYFTTEPLACAPSSLPKYPPSKEMDIRKLGETRKQASQIRRTNECQAVESIQEDSSLTKQLQRTSSESTSRETSYTKSYEEEETSSLQDHSPRQMQTATDMTTDDETGAEEDSFLDSNGRNQNLVGSMNMEEDKPWPMSPSPSRVNSTQILPSVYENGTSSSGRLGIMHTLIEDCTVN